MNQPSIRVEPVDNRHPAWGSVLADIFRTGNRGAVLLQEDGLLSSRQAVLAAFQGEDVVGHLCFSIAPARSTAGVPAIGSRVDSFRVADHHANLQISQSLVKHAHSLARLMKCGLPEVESAAG